MNYQQFWNERGLDFIIPPETDDPEGFDISKTLLPLCRGRVLEVGCGTGRIAKMFEPENYIGFDINRAAVDQARAALPKHGFFHSELQDYLLPKAETVLFYTVCLHIPDTMILDQLFKAGLAADRIVIAEIMNPKYRENRDPSMEYDLSNQRSLAEYEELMREIGFSLMGAVREPYKFYAEEHITFAVFERQA